MSTEHFTDESLCGTGPHSSVENSPSPEVISNLQSVESVLEELRGILCQAYGEDTPIFTKYGYRSPELNALCGGSETSAHLEGLAADTSYKGHTPDSIAAVAMRHPTFMSRIDQLIIEDGCLHVGLACRASGYVARHELRHRTYLNGVPHYQLVTIWHPQN
jgi:hypothetical protein